MSRWQRLSELFESALDVPQASREDWLRNNCGDETLVAEVQEMLAAHDNSTEHILDLPAQVYAADLIKTDVQEDRDESGAMVGSYRLLGEIGSGGMGRVYLAERADGQFEQRVAVKILKSDLSAGRLERRFLAERRILASLDHASVARILDAGVTEAGAPYFAMEYVEGEPITEYCKRGQLDIRRRLKLFLEVCEAVAHAHQRLVVHRDLKPSNILVREDGRVKLLDFGIAKVLEPDLVPGPAIQTLTGIHLMTPEYASPEQVRGEPVSIASDVYQLGLLLFELLAGQRPYNLDSHSITAIARAVLETEAPRPSTHVKLSRDLDAITLKALRKESSARYASADHLAADVRRFLDGRPVSAHRGSSLYRLSKFTRRYRLALAAGFLFAAILIGYALSITVQQAETARERDRAERYAEFVTDLFASPDPLADEARVDQRDITVEEFLDQASRRMQHELNDDPALRLDLLETVGEVYINLGANEKAEHLLREALTLSDRLHGEVSDRSVVILRRLGWVLEDSEVADSVYRHQLKLLAQLEPHGGPLTGRSLTGYGNLLHTIGDVPRADSVLTIAIEDRNWSGEDTEGQSGALLFKSRTEAALGDLNTADSLVRLSLDTRSDGIGPNHPRTAIILHHLAVVAEGLGQPDTALAIKQQVLDIWTASLGEDHPYTLAALNNLAITFETLGDYEKAEALMRESIVRRIRTSGERSREVAEARQNLGAMLMRRDRDVEAVAELTEAYDVFSEVRPDHYITAYPLLTITELRLRNGQFAEAEDASRRAMSHFSRTLSQAHPLYAVAQSRHGASLTGLGRHAEARSDLTSAIDILGSNEAFAHHHEAALGWLAELDEQP